MQAGCPLVSVQSFNWAVHVIQMVVFGFAVVRCCWFRVQICWFVQKIFQKLAHWWKQKRNWPFVLNCSVNLIRRRAVWTDHLCGRAVDWWFANGLWDMMECVLSSSFVVFPTLPPPPSPPPPAPSSARPPAPPLHKNIKTFITRWNHQFYHLSNDLFNMIRSYLLMANECCFWVSSTSSISCLLSFRAR